MRKRTQQGNMVTGMLIGVTVAVIALGGAYWFFNKQKPNYSNLQKNEEFAKQASNLESSQTETLTPAGASVEVPVFYPVDRNAVPVTASTEPIQSAQTNNNGNISWSDQPAASSNEGTKTNPSTTTGNKPVDTAKTQPPAKKDENIKQVAKRSYLQTGAFKDAREAEEQRAQLALMGVKAEVQSIDLGGSKGVFHRVRVGPFTNETQLKKTQTSLRGNNIDSNIVTPN